MGMGHGPRGGGKPGAKPKDLGQTFKRLMGYLTDTAGAKIRLIIVFVLVICSSGASIPPTSLPPPST